MEQPTDDEQVPSSIPDTPTLPIIAQRRGSAPVSFFQALSSIVSQLSVGSDLTRFTLPALFFQPISLLQKLTNIMSRGHLLINAMKQGDPLLRMLAIVQWQIGGLRTETMWGKKPFNPILGEQFSCVYDHGNDGETVFVAEQISHHPPVSAFHLYNTTLQFVLNSHVEQRAKFCGNYANVELVGPCTLHMCGTGERYDMALPNICVRGIMMGDRRVEWVGTLKVQCPQTGLTATVEYKQKGSFMGRWNAIEGKVSDNSGKLLCSIGGQWDENVTVQFVGQKEKLLMLNGTTEPELSYRDLDPPCHNDSRLIWGTAARHLEAEDYTAATEAKTAVEEEQRRQRKAGLHDAHVPAVFVKDEAGSWVHKEHTVQWMLEQAKLHQPQQTADGDGGGDAKADDAANAAEQ